MPRILHLTTDLVARVPPHSGESGKLAGRSDLSTDEDVAELAATLLKDRPENGEVWIFAYGSLIWAPDFDYAEERLGLVRGWHRSFCLGWVRLYRGTPERPGVMLALDRGGACKGVLFRLAPETMEANLHKILRREMPIKPTGKPSARWMSAQTAQGPVKAIGFPTYHRRGGPRSCHRCWRARVDGRIPAQHHHPFGRTGHPRWLPVAPASPCRRTHPRRIPRRSRLNGPCSCTACWPRPSRFRRSVWPMRAGLTTPTSPPLARLMAWHASGSMRLPWHLRPLHRELLVSHLTGAGRAILGALCGV
jgi:ChaC-like protein